MINNSVLLQHREDWIGALAIGLLVSCLLVASLIILMAIYFGGVVFVNTSNARVQYVNQDVGPYGQELMQSILQISNLSWQQLPNMTLDSAQYFTQKAWGLLLVPANFSDTLLTMPAHATMNLLWIYDEGKNKGSADTILQQFRNEFDAAVSRIVFSNNQTLINEPTFSTLRVHPVPYPWQENAILQIYVIQFIYSITSVGAIDYTYRFISKRLHARHVLLLRVMQGWTTTCLASLGIVGMYAAFGGTMEQGFVLFWMFSWLVMLAYLSIVACVLVTLGYVGSMFFTLLLVTQITSSSNVVDLEFVPGFYKIGMGLPMYHAVNGARHLLFGTRTNMGIHVLVLLSYFCCFFLIRAAHFFATHKKEEEREFEKSE